MGRVPFKYFAKQKDVKVFSISIQNINEKLESLQKIEAATISTNNINFQIGKIDKPSTDSKTIILEEYHNFLDVFSKKHPIPYQLTPNMITESTY